MNITAKSRIIIAIVAAAVVAPNRSLIVYGQDASGGPARAFRHAGAPEELTLPLAVEIALRTNPLMRATAAGREIADAQAQEAKAGRFPLVQLSETWISGNNPVFVFGSLLEQGRFAQRNFDLRSLNNPDPLNNFRFGVTIKAPLFDGRQTSTRIAVARLNQKQADAQTDQIAQRVRFRFEVVRAYQEYVTARERLIVAERVISHAAEALRIVQDRYHEGLTTITELLRAETALARARLNLLAARYDHYVGYASVLLATGGLTDVEPFV